MKLYFVAKENKILRDGVKEPTIGITKEASGVFRGFDVDLVEYGLRTIPYVMAVNAYVQFSQGNTFMGFMSLGLPAIQILSACTKFHDKKDPEVNESNKPSRPAP